MSRRAGVVVALGVALLARAASATDVPEGIYDEAVTWTAAGSPYLVTGDVQFARLTIEAGTTVLVSSTNTAANGRINLVVTTLVVNGTSGSPVVFQPEIATTSPSGWQGLWVRGSAAITGAIMRNANDGILLFADRSPIAPSTISRTTFDTGAYVIMVQRGDVSVDAITVTNVAHGIVNQNTGSVQVTNSSFRGTATPIYSTGPVSVVNCTFDRSQTGIEFRPSLANSAADIRNTIITNGGTGVLFDSGSAPAGTRITITDSDVWGNTANFGGVTPGAGTISVDPRYVSATDLHLQAASPCVDSGGATGAPDHDLDLVARPKGAKVDMGAYEHDPASGASGRGGVGGVGGSAGGSIGVGGEGGRGGAGGEAAQGGGGSGGSAGSGGSGGTAGGSAGRGGVAGGSDAGVDGPISMKKGGCTDCGIGGARSDGPSAACWTFVFMLTAWWRGRRRARAPRRPRCG